MSYHRPEEGTQWGATVDVPPMVQQFAAANEVKAFANSRHVVTLHLAGTPLAADHSRFLAPIVDRIPSANAKTLDSDGSLIVQMRERDFCQHLGGKVAHLASGIIV